MSLEVSKAPSCSCPSVDADDTPCQIKAGFGILMPMMCALLDQFTQPLSEADVLRGAPAIKKALEEVHKKQIWHNDVKPGNIFIDSKGYLHHTLLPTNTLHGIFDGGGHYLV